MMPRTINLQIKFVVAVAFENSAAERTATSVLLAEIARVQRRFAALEPLDAEAIEQLALTLRSVGAEQGFRLVLPSDHDQVDL